MHKVFIRILSKHKGAVLHRPSENYCILFDYLFLPQQCLYFLPLPAWTWIITSDFSVLLRRYRISSAPCTALFSAPL